MAQLVITLNILDERNKLTDRYIYFLSLLLSVSSLQITEVH